MPYCIRGLENREGWGVWQRRSSGTAAALPITKAESDTSLRLGREQTKSNGSRAISQPGSCSSRSGSEWPFVTVETLKFEAQETLRPFQPPKLPKPPCRKEVKSQDACLDRITSQLREWRDGIKAVAAPRVYDVSVKPTTHELQKNETDAKPA